MWKLPGQVWLIGFLQVMSNAAIPLMVFLGALIGAELAPNPTLATAPIAVMVVGTALAAGIVPSLMRRLGRKAVFVFTATVGLLNCALLAFAVQSASFPLFLCGSVVLGMSAAVVQHYRFAAMEQVPLHQQAQAASLVLLAGIGSAFVGPELAVAGQELTGTRYVGSFLLIGLCYIVVLVGLQFFVPAANAESTPAESNSEGRSFLHEPLFWCAVASGAIGYSVMSFVMTATPISMHHIHGHSLETTKFTIQSHIAAMYLPSLFSGWLIGRLGIRGLILLGVVAYVLSTAVAALDTSGAGFWTALVLLGVGWNFMFVAGTTLLPRTYGNGDPYRAQTINEFTIFSTQAVASLSAGLVLNAIGWQAMVIVSLAPLALISLMVLRYRQRPGW